VIPAGNVRPGQFIWTSAGWARVLKVETIHGVTHVTVGGGSLHYRNTVEVGVQDYAEGGD